MTENIIGRCVMILEEVEKMGHESYQMLKEFIMSTHVSRQMYKGNTEVENHALFFIFGNGSNPIKSMSTCECCFPFFDMSNEQLGNSEYFDKLLQWANVGLWFIYPYSFIKKLMEPEFYVAVRAFPYHKFINKIRAQSIP
jgi:hypothetical protein